MLHWSIKRLTRCRPGKLPCQLCQDYRGISVHNMHVKLIQFVKHQAFSEPRTDAHTLTHTHRHEHAQKQQSKTQLTGCAVWLRSCVHDRDRDVCGHFSLAQGSAVTSHHPSGAFTPAAAPGWLTKGVANLLRADSGAHVRISVSVTITGSA